MASRPSDLTLNRPLEGNGRRVPMPGMSATPVTELRFALPHASRGSLVVVDSTDRVVRTLIYPIVPGGEVRAGWDGLDELGDPAARGSYCLRLEVEGRLLTSRRVELR